MVLSAGIDTCLLFFPLFMWIHNPMNSSVICDFKYRSDTESSNKIPNLFSPFFAQQE